MGSAKRKRGLKFLMILAGGFISYLNAKVVAKIPAQEIQDFFNERLEELRKVVEILRDKDPEDSKQLKELWQEDIVPSLEDSGLDVAKAIIRKKVKDTETRTILLNILDQYEEEKDLESQAQLMAFQDMQSEAA